MSAEHRDGGVSEALGAIVLISVVVAGITIAGYSILSGPHPQNVPALSVDSRTAGRTISLVHEGGDSLSRDRTSILVDGVDLTGSFRAIDGGTWSTWAVGEALTYTVPQGQPMPQTISLVDTGSGSGRIITSVSVSVP